MTMREDIDKQKDKYRDILYVCADHLNSGHTLEIIQCIARGGGLGEIKSLCSRTHSKHSLVAHKVNAILEDRELDVSKLPKRIRDQGR